MAKITPYFLAHTHIGHRLGYNRPPGDCLFYDGVDLKAVAEKTLALGTKSSGKTGEVRYRWEAGMIIGQSPSGVYGHTVVIIARQHECRTMFVVQCYARKCTLCVSLHTREIQIFLY
jgi:hypothetical protein